MVCHLFVVKCVGEFWLLLLNFCIETTDISLVSFRDYIQNSKAIRMLFMDDCRIVSLYLYVVCCSNNR